MAETAIAERGSAATTTIANNSLKAGRRAHVLRVFAHIRDTLKPDYEWGRTYGWERLDCQGEGWGRHLQLEWLGLKLSIAVGRRPPKGSQRW